MQKTSIALTGAAVGMFVAFLVSGVGLPLASAAKRRIYNEGNEAWAAPPGNPAW